jgi:hypothetical protein
VRALLIRPVFAFLKNAMRRKNAGTLGVLAKNRSVIYRADGMLWVDVLEPAKAEA